MKAELYGFLLFSNTFTAKEIIFMTGHIEILKRYEDFFNSLNIKDYTIAEKGKENIIYTFKINNSDIILKFLKSLNNCSIQPPLHIDYSVLEKECCISSFLRGAFIAGGFISDPQKTYQLEITTSHFLLADDFAKLCSEFDIYPKMTTRRGNRILYIKTAESIKDFLTVIGSLDYMFDFTNTVIIKDMRNDINRIVNCESANIDKTVIASKTHIQAINTLKALSYEGLNEQLKEIAELRLENPELSLEQLGQLCNPPITKSGVSHRLKKLCEIAENINMSINKKGKK
jgi:DNA-binding protein WhiA